MAMGSVCMAGWVEAPGSVGTLSLEFSGNTGRSVLIVGPPSDAASASSFGAPFNVCPREVFFSGTLNKILGESHDHNING